MKRSIPVIMYHHVSPNPGLVTVSPTTFTSHMEALAHLGWETLTAARFLEFLRGRIELPRRSVLITFDDGYLDNYVYAYPVLKRFNQNAVIFGVTGWFNDGPPRGHIGHNGFLPETPSHGACHNLLRQGRGDEVMLRWSEIEAMQGVVEMHSHTHTHRRWDKDFPFPPVRLKNLEEDLTTARDILKSRLGVTEPQLCWPWGVWDTAYREMAIRLGYTAFYTTVPGINLGGAGGGEIKRFPVKNRGALWLITRLMLYGHPALGTFYSSLKGRNK